MSDLTDLLNEPDFADFVRRALERGAAKPRSTLFDYWGPRGFVLDSPVAPGIDYYRLVNEDTGAAEAMAAGEPPLHGHRGMTPQQLEQQRVLQWEGPNRLFNRTTDGRVESMDDPDNGTFVPLWNSEGETGGLHERQRLIEHLLQTNPDLLREPGVLPVPGTSAAPPLIDLAAAFRPRVSLATPAMLAQMRTPSGHDIVTPLWQAGAPALTRETPQFGITVEERLERRPHLKGRSPSGPPPVDLADPSRLDHGPSYGNRLDYYQRFRRQGVPDSGRPDSYDERPEQFLQQDMPRRLLDFTDEPAPPPPAGLRTEGVIPLAQAWPHLLGRLA